MIFKHDRVFRTSMLDKRVARDFFEQHLSKEILKHLNLDKLEPCPQSYITNELKLTESDVLYKTEFKGKPAYLYLLCEQQTKPDKLTPFRILQYNVGIWTDHLKQTQDEQLPLILNVVFYNGLLPYTYSTDIRDLINAPRDLVDAVWNQPFQLIEVNKIPDEALLRHQWAGILEFFMKHRMARDFLPRLQSVIELLHHLELEGGREYVITLLNYSMEAVETADVEGFVEIIKKGLSTEVGEKIMTIAEQLTQRGIQTGIQRGLEQGIAYERAMLSNLLKHRFGDISPESLNRLEKADGETLLSWSEKIFDAKQIEDIFV